MKNRDLLQAIENHLVCIRKYVLESTDRRQADLKESELLLKQAVQNIPLQDIAEMFSDLREYWDTLEVGK
jgi:hypothetical protein